MSEAGRTRLSSRSRLVAVVVGILAAVGLVVAFNWTTLTTTPTMIFGVEGFRYDREFAVDFRSCPEQEHVVSVDERVHEVRVVVRLEDGHTDDCERASRSAPISLQTPLGDRPVIDESTGLEVHVYTVVGGPNEG